MRIFYRRRTEPTAEITLDNYTKTNNRSDVLDTIESLEIPRDRLIVVGSGVLALLGLDRRAHDLDVILDPEYLDSLHATSQLPSGLAVSEATFSRPERLHFNADTQPLPSELFSHRTALTRQSFNDFMNDNSVPIQQIDALVDPTNVPEDLRVIRPGILLANKMDRLYIGTPEEKARKSAQDAYDQDLITRHKLF